MTDSQREPAQQNTSRGQVVGSDVLWVRLRIDRAQPGVDWRELISATTGGETEDPQLADAGDQTSLPSDVEQQVRDQLESIIGMIREQAQAPAQSYEYTDDELKSLDELAADPEKFDDLIQQIMQAELEEEDTDELPEPSESEPADLTTEQLQALTGDLTPEAQAAIEELNWEIIPDLEGYLESAATVTALETDGRRAQLFVLCERVPGQASLRTVQTDGTGVLLPGQPLADFLTQLEQTFPGATDLLPQKPGEDYYLASFSQGTDSLNLDPWGKSAALVELSMAGLATYMQPELMHGDVEAAPADKGWSLITADPPDSSQPA
ncbi:hypothetical protein ACFP6B_07735 [Rothia nasimurium]|uniref:hypothetical protein n=1 Tax=Rothia nasimurium TaxID=85336 RepID=UPI0036095C2A